MRKIFSLLFLVSVFSSCTETFMDNEQFEIDREQSKHNSNNHTVRYIDILALNQVQNANTRSSSPETSEIECITNQSKDTVLYVSKKQGGGWTMYASDTRVPAIVAHSGSGSFEKLMQIDGAKLWIESIVEDMTLIKRLPDEMLNFSQKEIADNKSFWKAISSPDEYVKDNLLPKTRADEIDHILTTGHYELRFTTPRSEVYDSIRRMTTTDWHQDHPYNYYCPKKSDNSMRAAAGCVAIAAGQMLYYLHNYYGVPATAPSEAYCNGNINSYTWEQTNYTTSIWEEMDNSTKAAPLIADIGRRINMEYHDKESSAPTADLPENVFAPYGISCSYT
ncbi:MAG: C10 family peptidase, partial [Bacteroidaceae bacterium]|nr:C10 family peptidase [Bacteroidaceae bacterium]